MHSSLRAPRAFHPLRAACAALLCVPLLAAAASPTETLPPERAVAAAGNRLVAALRQYEQAAPAQRDEVRRRLADAAAERAALLAALMSQRPDLAAAQVLPDAVRARLAASARVEVETSRVADGRLEAVVTDDPDRGVSTRRLELVDRAGTRLRLAFAAGSEDALLRHVGRTVRVRGALLRGTLLADDASTVEVLAAGGGTTAEPTATGATVQGDQRTLVVLVNFSDAALACSASDVHARLLATGTGSMNDAYRQSSGNLVSFSGKVVGPYTIPQSVSGTCDPSAWASAASAAARAAGNDPAGYMRVSYALPRNANCPYAGQATLGGQAPTPSWVMQCERTGLFSHELGHNLLFHHASTPTSEYGDATDPMGGMINVQFNAANRAMAGWLAGRIVDVVGGGSYAIDALENMGSANPLVLRMPKPDTNEFYYVSLRQPVGVDTALPLFAQGALSVHRATGSLPARTVRVANLAVGQTWTDSVNGISVTHQALTAAGATVGVSRSGASCSRTAPTIESTPMTQSGAPGSTLRYALKVSNNNSAACPSAGFNLAQSLPAGFVGAFSANTVQLASGASATIEWNVGSPASAGDGVYGLTARAVEAGTSSSAEVRPSYTVLAPVKPAVTDTTAPSLTITSPAAGAVLSPRGSATLAAEASDASGIAAVEFRVDGVWLATDTSAPYTASWNLRKAGTGTHVITVRARDAAGNVAERSVTVTIAR